MNAERKARHLAPFAWDGLLARRATAWAQSLLAANRFKHQDLGAIATAANGRFAEVGENLFSGTGGAADAGTAHLALMHSTEHRENLLLPRVSWSASPRCASRQAHGRRGLRDQDGLRRCRPPPGHPGIPVVADQRHRERTTRPAPAAG